LWKAIQRQAEGEAGVGGRTVGGGRRGGIYMASVDVVKSFDSIKHAKLMTGSQKEKNLRHSEKSVL
jgi:hypothetical protein